MSSLAALARRLAVVATGVLAVPLLATAASAHVAVSSADAVRGGEAGLLSFRVPTESATAGTVKVTIELPSDAPVGFVDTQPLAGWTATTTERSLAGPTKVGDFTLDKAIASITWTADPGVQVGPNQFQLFQLLLGPLPDRPTMVFSATQYYSDGSVVHWNQPYPASGVEPDHPTPVLDLGTDPSTTVPPTSDGTARTLGGAGLLVGVLGLGFGALGLRRRDRGDRPTGTTP